MSRRGPVDLLALQGQFGPEPRAIGRRPGTAGLTCAGGHRLLQTCPRSGSERIAMRLRPALRSSTLTGAVQAEVVGDDQAGDHGLAQGPSSLRSLRSSAPLTGCSVNMTPAAIGC